MKIAFAFAATALATLAVPAAADGGAPTGSVVISDLDLADAKDRDILGRRIETTVRQICDSGRKDLAGRVGERQCRRDARASVEERIALATAKAETEKLAAIRAATQG